MRKVILSAVLLAGLLNATDFSSMSTEDLLSLRGTVSTEEQAAFQQELQSRVQSMTTEEREALGITPGANAQGNGYGTTARDGSGIGSMGDAAGGMGGGLGGGAGSGMGGGGHGGGHGRR